MTSKGPKPTVEWNGKTYSLRAYSTAIPDLSAMSSLAATVWIAQNTTPRGHQNYARVNIQGLTLKVK